MIDLMHLKIDELEGTTRGSGLLFMDGGVIDVNAVIWGHDFVSLCASGVQLSTEQ